MVDCYGHQDCKMISRYPKGRCSWNMTIVSPAYFWYAGTVPLFNTLAQPRYKNVFRSVTASYLSPAGTAGLRTASPSTDFYLKPACTAAPVPC